MREKQYLQSGAAYHVFFTCETYSKLNFSFKAAWHGFCTPHKPSLCESEESKWFLFAFLPSSILKVPLSAKAMSEKHFIIPDSLVEEYVKSLENKNKQGKTKRYVKLLLLLLLFKAKVVSLTQKGGGKEFELRSQTPTKQP